MADSKLVYYPIRFWGLDQLYQAKVKLNVADALSLKEYPGFSGVYSILNHPISNVHLLGDVVSISQKNKFIQYEIDDGTGTIQCYHWRPVEGSDQGMVVPELGNLVSVFGKLSEYNGKRQIRVLNIMMETDPNVEPMHWLEVVQLKRTVYSRAFVLSPGAERFGMGEDSTKEPLRVTVSNILLNILKQCPPFTLTQLRSDMELKERVIREVLSCQDGLKDVDRGLVGEELSTVIGGLAREGLLIRVTEEGVMGPSMEERYEVLVEEKHLCPSIVEFIKQKSPKTVHGVSESWIVDFVNQSHRNIPTSRILTAIDRLVETSDIYPVGPKLYKTVN